MQKMECIKCIQNEYFKVLKIQQSPSYPTPTGPGQGQNAKNSDNQKNKKIPLKLVQN